MSAITVEEVKIVFTTDSKDASKNINSLTSTLERLEKISKSTEKQGSKIDERLKSIRSTLGKAAKWANMFTDKCAEWFKASNDYVEALNLFEVSMGKSTKTASAFAKQLQTLMGIDIQEWMNYQGGFNQMLEGFGLRDDISAQMSQQLTQIAYDLSSLWNVDVETAFQKVQSGISGQIKGLKVWGINLSVAQLKETALAHGIELSTSKMTEAQKATLRYITIMEKTQNVQGDLARTIITPANAMRILSAQTTQAKRSLGNIVSVIVVKAIPVLQVIVKYIDLAASKIASFMGYELPQIDYSGISDTSSAFDSLDDSMKDALETSKKLKKSLMGFDELNILQAPTSSNSSVLGGGLPSDLGLDLDKYSYDFTKGLQGFDTAEIERVLANITAICMGSLLAIGVVLFATGANIPLGITLAAIGAAGLATTLKLSWGTIGDNIQTVISTIAGIVGGSLLALGALFALTGVDVPLGIGLMIVGATTLASTVAVNWYSTSNKVSEIISIITASVSAAMLALGMILLLSGGSAPLGIALLLGGAVTLASTIAVNWNTMSDKMRGILTTITGIVGGSLLAIGMILTILGHYGLGIPILLAGVASLATSVALNWNTLSSDLSSTLQIIAGVVGGFMLVLGAVLTFSGVNIPLGIAMLVTGCLGIATSIALNWDTVKSKIKTVLSSILSIVSGAAIALGILLCLSGGGIGLGIALIRAGLSGVKKADEVSSNPVTKWIKSICNGAIDLVEKAVNKCIKLINKFGFSWDVPDWLQSVVGFSKLEVGANLSEVSIPRLAKGGINIPNGQIFQARESGPELVGTIGNKSAVVNNDQIVESVEGGVFRGVMAALQNSHNGNGNGRAVIEAHFYLDGQEITDNVIEHHNDYVKANGSSPLLIGG